ncbi:canalicular multispecific organic anion transporter 1 [Coccidioides immitis RMSCC 2394]|uniref:Canalicular multispecific organic anion transporter 1 n=1 Tax=Coccidioides immitis RMSCC 2394 TaxID=404692 RepID=A0A0J6Y4J3_COCIT|nr:canalicular multispecific organic anion transporter 1 [Coccidioides immitis RMSCC 2394]
MASQNLSTCGRIDDTFGPYALHCRGGFDFTLLFEETFLTIIPVGLLLLVIPFRVYYLFKKRKKVNDGPLVHLKLTALAAFAVLHLILLVLWTRPSVERTRTSLVTSALTLGSALTFCLLSYFEHIRTVKPSFLLSVYFLITLPFDAARCRTLWLRRTSDYGYLIALTFTVTVALKVIILVLEAAPKRGILKPEYQAYPPEATSGVINRSFFWWVNPLFWFGYSNLLSIENLFNLDKHLVSERVHQRMEAAWSKVKSKGPNSLLWVTIKVLKWRLMSIIFPRLCLIGFTFAQPFLINRAIKFASQPESRTSEGIGNSLIGAYILVYIGIAVSMGQYQHLTYRAITMARGGLIGMLYRKATDLSIKDVDPASSLTLMSADIERIVQGWQTMHEMWANIIEVGIAIFLLYIQLGVACAVPIAVSILSLVLSIIAMNFVTAHQALWLEAIERRISATTVMLGSMKGVKMCGLKQTLLTNLHNLRIEELTISKKFRKLLIWNMGFAYVSQVFSPILTFTVFSILAKKNGDNSILDFARVFTSLSLFALLSEPLQSLILALVTFLGSVGCFSRIQQFLDKPSRVDPRHKPMDIPDDIMDSSQSFPATEHNSMTTEKTRVSSALSVAKLSFPFKDAPQPLADGDVVTIQDGSFGWDPDKQPLLREISLSIPREKLTMIVGPVGCGKSTLLKAILGEVPCMGGRVDVATLNMAYCDQTAWHMNESIRDSITAVSGFDEQWYTTVLRACSLEEDLQQLPRGDRTIVGSKGIALSGGQSQRISLARAVYAQKDVIILDDVLSGIDASTENHIFHNLLGQNGLLRRIHSTIILVSSSPKRLPYSDYIIALDAEGKICEQGSFQTLNSAAGYVSSFSLPPPDWTYKADPDAHRGVKSIVQEDEPDNLRSNEALEAEANRRTGDVGIYLYYVGSVGWFAALMFVVFVCGFVFCIAYPTIWLKEWASANIENPYQRLGYYLGIYVMLGFLAIICLIASCWQMIITMVPKSGEAFHLTLLKTVLSAPMSFFSTTDTGVTINRFSQDLQLIDMELPVAALNTFAVFVLCIAQMIIIGVASVYGAISFPVVLVALYFIQRYYLRTSRQLRFMDLEAKAPLYSQFSECLNGLATIRAFGWQKFLEEKNRRLLDRSQKPFYLLFSVQRWLTLVLDLVVAGIATILIILVVKLRGTIGGGFAGVALLNVIQFSQSIKLLITFWTTLETHIGAIARIKVFNETMVAEDKVTENNMPPTNWPGEGGIEFQNVSAEYRPGEPVLRNVSLKINPGEKIGICGRTGSGKSSMVLSIFRMIELSGGTITVDGVDLSTIPRQEIRSRITGVAQDAFLLKGTLRLNADPTGFLSDGAIINALKSVHLWSVVDENGGLDADIDDLHLSHGQRQLLCLARAMLRPSKILILDEATSNVDRKTDEIMQRVIREKLSRHTIIAVAHKLDTILDFDKVALLDGGVLKEFDDPYTLLSADSDFSKLYASTMSDQPDEVGIMADDMTVSSEAPVSR